MLGEEKVSEGINYNKKKNPKSYKLEDWLKVIKVWSDFNQLHTPITIFLQVITPYSSRNFFFFYFHLSKAKTSKCEESMSDLEEEMEMQAKINIEKNEKNNEKPPSTQEEVSSNDQNDTLNSQDEIDEEKTENNLKDDLIQKNCKNFILLSFYFNKIKSKRKCRKRRRRRRK